jgi:steroid delta-isomerase-like uncharacterized protein
MVPARNLHGCRDVWAKQSWYDADKILIRGDASMLTEENKKVMRRWGEEWNRGNLEGVFALFAQDFVDHNPQPDQAPGVEGVRQALRRLFEAFPDSQLTVELLVAEEDKVTDCGFLTGTHKGSLFGIPPTGKKVTIRFMDIHRLKDGKIIEGWHIEDLFGALQQIGAIPAPQSAHA